MANILNKSEQQYLHVRTGPRVCIRRTNVLKAVVDMFGCLGPVAALVTLFKLTRSHSNSSSRGVPAVAAFNVHLTLELLDRLDGLSLQSTADLERILNALSSSSPSIIIMSSSRIDLSSLLDCAAKPPPSMSNTQSDAPVVDLVNVS